MQKQFEKLLPILGQHIMDKVTELTGMCTMVCIQSDGQLRVEITPKAINNVPAETHFYDLAQVRKHTYKENNINYREAIPVVEHPDFFDLEFLKVYKDEITNFKGKLTALLIYTNGCVHAKLVKGVTEKGDTIYRYVPVQQLKNAPVRTKSDDAPGGPISSSPSMRVGCQH